MPRPAGAVRPAGRGPLSIKGDPQEKIWGISNFSLAPLETTKGRAEALPLETIPGGTGDFGETRRGRFAARFTGDVGPGDEGWVRGACGHSEYSA